MKRTSGYWRWVRYQYLRLARINDTPEKIAGGLALGAAIGILPSFGIGIIAAVFIAGFVGLNRVSAFIGTLVMNPWTAPFVWAASYLTGSLVIGDNLHETIEVVRELKTQTDLWGSLLASKLLLPYVVGNVIVTGALSAVFYVGGLVFVRGYRRAKARRLYRKFSERKRQ